MSLPRGLRRPRRLRAGDRVAVVAPSGPVDPERLDRGCAVLRDLGLEPFLGRHVRGRHGFLAAPDPDRARDLVAAWCDPTVSAVVAARGGYGATRLTPLLDWERMRAADPKVLVGSSDVTALHGAIGRRLGIVTLFGPMPAGSFGAGIPDPDSLEHLRRTLFEPERALEVGRGHGLVGGRARGRLVGGTLSLLAAGVGTTDLPSSRNALVVLEDVAEAAYRVDRMLTQLLRAGWFDRVVGVAAGSWSGCGDGVEDVLAERLGTLGVPVVAGLPFGHGNRQHTVPLGAVATLDAGSGAVTLARPALA